MVTHDRSGSHLRALLAGGDWACAHCNPMSLALVAERLRALVDDDEQRALGEVVRLVDVDMLEASGLWNQATHRLRERYLGCDAPARPS